jgi:putative ABC transport system permease protein
METRNKTGLTTAAAVLVLALAFGALGAALAAGKAVLWEDLPFKEPSRLVQLGGIMTEKGEVQPWAIGHLDFLDWRRQNRVFESMSVFTDADSVAFNLRTAGGLKRQPGELVSHTYFATLGIEPALGRFFTAREDAEPFVHPIVVLSHGLWQRELGADPSIVGRTVNLNGKDWQVIGVTPEGFRGATDSAEFWIPSSMVPGSEYIEVRRMRWLYAAARLKPGVTLEQAQEDMNRITAALEQQYPDQNRGIGVKLQPLRGFMFAAELKDGTRTALKAGALLLLLAVVDAAGLLRNAGTRRGTGSGIGPGISVAIVGAVLGVLLAAWGVRALMQTSGFKIPSFASFSPGPGLLAGLLALAVVCGLLIALLARWRPTRVLVAIAALVQIVLAVGLLVRVGGLSRDFRQVVEQDLGFRTDNLLTMRLNLDQPQWAKDSDVAVLAGVYLRRLGALPEVEDVAITGPAMATDGWAGAFITAEDHDNPESDDGTYRILSQGVSPDFFKIMDVPVLQGRAFNSQDTQGYHVIMSKSLAAAVWPGQSPLGRRVKFSARKVQPRPWLTVVGVVDDARYQGYFNEERPAPDFYLSVLQQPVRLPMILNVLARPRAGVSMERLETALRRGILVVTPEAPPYDVATLEARLDKQTWKSRFQVRLVGISAALMLALAAAGVWAALAARREGRLGERAGEVFGTESPASPRRAAH